MHVTKKTIAELEKCYSIAELNYNGKRCMLVAAEKHAPCYLFDMGGHLLDTVWEEPGGVMTMAAIPGRENMFMATQKFYSPNDAKEAQLVVASKEADGPWKITKVADLPFVHRFDLISRNGVTYVIACTLKSGHRFKDDWGSPGKVYAGLLPDDPRTPLELKPIADGLLKNHGYSRYEQAGIASSVISCEEGVFRFTPPEEASGAWKIERLLDEPCSDAVLLDMDKDGIPELFALCPFHGDQINVYSAKQGKYEKVYAYPRKTPFLHAIDYGVIDGEAAVICGCREGGRELWAFRYAGGRYICDVLDRDCGPANCKLTMFGGKYYIWAANREINEIAIYEIDL